MAYSSWIKAVDPSQGSGNGTVKVTGFENTGRNVRNTTLTITAANVEPKTVTVNQAGKPEYVTEDENATAAKTGQTVTIEGKSNSSKLTFSLGTTGDLDVTLPESYTANGLTVQNAVAIDGDPGASKEYNFSIQFVVGENETTEEHSKQIIVTDNAGHTATCTLTQAAGDATLVVSVDSLDMDYQGSEVSFTITSNTSWKIS